MRKRYVVSIDLLVLVPNAFGRAFPQVRLIGLPRKRTVFVATLDEVVSMIVWLRARTEQERCAYEQVRLWSAIAGLEAVWNMESEHAATPRTD